MTELDPAAAADDLELLLKNNLFDQARILSSKLSISNSYTDQRQLIWLLEHPPQLTSTLLSTLLADIPDREWVALASLQAANLAVNLAVTKAAVNIGLQATDDLVDKSSFTAFKEAVMEEGGDGTMLVELCKEDESVRKICWVRRALLEIRDRASTWQEVWGSTEDPEEVGTSARVQGKAHRREATLDEEDAWGVNGDEEEEDEDEEAQDEESSIWNESHDPLAPSIPNDELPTLATFLHQPLLDTALSLAATASLEPLVTVCSRHSKELWPARALLLEAIPEWEDPLGYLALLPKFNDNLEHEAAWPSTPHRLHLDWAENSLPSPTLSLTLSKSPPTHPLSREEATSYYASRIEHMASLGLTSVALSLVQHGASFGIPNLDELGEELSLLSKLAYDRPPPRTPQEIPEELTLTKWRQLTPREVVSKYLSHSLPSTISSDIRRLVLPYLSVLESHLERAGTPDLNLSNSLLYSFILELSSSISPTTTEEELKLQNLVSIFEASKPTLPRPQRVIKSDSDLARLALACLYGTRSTTSNAIVSLGKVFECLPAFESETSSSQPTTLVSLLATSSNTTPPTSQSLFALLKPFSTESLSLSLDTLDVHLSTAETFSRYSSPVPLSWFLTSHNNPQAQRAWATRLARTSASGGGGRSGDEAEFESEDEWVGLMEEMVALGEEGRAFEKVGKDELLKIFFGGLLGAGSEFLFSETSIVYVSHGRKLMHGILNRVRIG